MSQTSQEPRSGLAKLLDEAPPGTPIAEILAQKEEYECPECGWRAELRRNTCFVCDYDQPLQPLLERTAVERGPS